LDAPLLFRVLPNAMPFGLSSRFEISSTNSSNGVASSQTTAKGAAASDAM
jgi:hypothetical protein